MTVNKQFAQEGGELDASMDQLIEVLAQLLDEPASPQNQDAALVMADLHSEYDGGIHVIENKPTK
jgi:hypothetical protein